MVKLLDDYQKDQELFSECGIKVPNFKQEDVVKEGLAHPQWIHFGGGNLFRSFHSLIAQDLIDQGLMQCGISVIEAHSDHLVKEVYQPFNNRSLSVILNNDGTLDKRLIASVNEDVFDNPNNPSGWNEATSIFQKPSLQFATLTITEKGYALRGLDGKFTPQVIEDIEKGPAKVQTTMGLITRLLYVRCQAGQLPIAMVSTDNFSQNGKVLHDAVLTIAQEWKDRGFVDQGFIDYLDDTNKVTFPWTMIDRITPGPSAEIAHKLKKEGFEDTEIVHNTAPFANTEPVHYLVIEDVFPNGRPPLEKAGALMVSRETVNDADQMKVTACLNPLHTALAIFGCLLDYHSIFEEVQDQDVLNLIKNLGYGEDLPVVKDPKVIDPKRFLDEFINQRLTNKYIPDTPQRIATDTSQKVAVRYGVTLQHYVNNPEKDPRDLNFIPLVIAAWCRYLLGFNDQLQAIDLSHDPLLDQLQSFLEQIKIRSHDNDVHQALKPILSNQEIFGLDLYQIGIGEKIENDFEKMISGKNAVRQTLQDVLEKFGTQY